MREDSVKKYEIGALSTTPSIEKPMPASLTRPAFNIRRSTFGVLLIAFFASSVIAVGMGAVEISPLQVLAILTHKIGLDLPVAFDGQQESVLIAIRLPRVLLGILVGSGLAVAGAVMQSLFRNPLADPGLVGVSGGSALAAAFMLVVGENLAFSFYTVNKVYFLPIAAFAGGLAATTFIYRVGKRKEHISVATMLLAGIAVNAFAGAGTGLMAFLATDTQLRNLNNWFLGSLSSATWENLPIATLFIGGSLFFLFRMSRSFNVILLGESEAKHLGVNTEQLKRRAICLVALAVGAAVAVSGTIGFIGLVIPHLLRLINGSDHRYLLKNSALLGAILIVGADAIGRNILAPAEVPIGVVTALIGAPFLIWLLIRQRL